MKWLNIDDQTEHQISDGAHLQKRVLAELMKEESLETKELNERIDSSGCYSACVRLKKIGIVEGMKLSKPIIWDPVTRQVLTRDNFAVSEERRQQEREKLTKRFKAQGLSDDEISSKVSYLVDPKRINKEYWVWWISKKWRYVAG
jgi:hypothetical protein